MNDSSLEPRSSDRRSSVRVKSMLPFGTRLVDPEEIPALESRILDLAVVESDGAHQQMVDWSERTEDISRDVMYILAELRSLRQRVSELQRLVDLQNNELEPRWLVINDRGLWLPRIDSDPDWSKGDYVEVRLQIPSLSSPEVLAVGELLRVSTDPGNEGAAIEFRSISQIHSKAIIRYALRRERQLARSQLLKLSNI